MPITDWSMTILGYQKHIYSGSEVIGVSHISTHDALVIADAVGMHNGWIWCDEMAAQLEDLPSDRPTWNKLSDLFEEERVIKTEGMVGGLLSFAAVAEDLSPKADRQPREWAEDNSAPWLESIDNEMAFFGGLSEDQQRKLMLWFLCRRPLNGQWQEMSLDDVTWADLRKGLFHGGWSRNCNLVEDGRRVRQELWCGVHENCALDIADRPRLSLVNSGLKLRSHNHAWAIESREDKCPLDDDYARLFPPVRK
ncbi:MAG: hypothetical protein HRU15_01370 [Planctomycetes bacterium]|nr:hypothetical protein [Planctomycetota bacterium]